MNVKPQSAMLDEASQPADHIGNMLVLHLNNQIRDIEAIARTLSSIVSTTLHSQSVLHQLLAAVVDFEREPAIASCGVWIEPFALHDQHAGYSLYFARNEPSVRVETHDYETAPPKYQQETWYQVSKQLKPGQCFWGKAYVHPNSGERVITCTTPLGSGDTFRGVVALDLQLDALQNMLDIWQQSLGGYGVVLDSGNQFLTLPTPAWKTPDLENAASQFGLESVQQLAQRSPQYAVLLETVNTIDAEMIEASRTTPRGAAIAQSFNEYATGIANEQQIAAILADPLAEHDRTNYLLQRFEIANDECLQEGAIACVFHIPHVYWKLLIVKPRSALAPVNFSLVHTDKMAMLGSMLASIAHEMNNPLNFVVGNLSYAETYMQDVLSVLKLYRTHYPDPVHAIQSASEQVDLSFVMQDLPKLMASMKMGADRALQITRLLRNFSRMDEGKQRQFVDIAKELDNTLLILNSRLKAKLVQVTGTEYHLPEITVVKQYQPTVKVECYSGLLSQVFMNLLVNAIDALEEATKSKQMDGTENFSPTIWIHTKRTNDDQVRIQIVDNGPGIPQHIQQRLFEPFFTTKPMGKGTGLGLAICQQIIHDQHGGMLTCQSKPGQGTTFTIALPAASYS
ncbi:ATP-binding protein [Leptolyngbya sp. AN02str]|uniref:ATP-binding protein n=1 Tax=Leptolyngbya sp. AN02str TaxID=3423363 RepID=UPI003D31FFA7